MLIFHQVLPAEYLIPSIQIVDPYRRCFPPRGSILLHSHSAAVRRLFLHGAGLGLHARRNLEAGDCVDRLAVQISSETVADLLVFDVLADTSPSRGKLGRL